MNFFRTAILLNLFSISLICDSCAPRGGDSFLRRTTAAANGHIMLVREFPPTFGFNRLSALSSQYPDLIIFLNQKKYPDFLAETNKAGNRYLILYYLNARKAFAARCGEGNSRQVEFSGPYPITDGEARTLKSLREGATSPKI